MKQCFVVTWFVLIAWFGKGTVCSHRGCRVWCDTVNGMRKPSTTFIPLMGQKSSDHQLIWRISHFSIGFHVQRVVYRISSINSNTSNLCSFWHWRTFRNNKRSNHMKSDEFGKRTVNSQTIAIHLFFWRGCSCWRLQNESGCNIPSVWHAIYDMKQKIHMSSRLVTFVFHNKYLQKKQQNVGSSESAKKNTGNWWYHEEQVYPPVDQHGNRKSQFGQRSRFLKTFKTGWKKQLGRHVHSFLGSQACFRILIGL